LIEFSYRLQHCFLREIFGYMAITTEPQRESVDVWLFGRELPIHCIAEVSVGCGSSMRRSRRVRVKEKPEILQGTAAIPDAVLPWFNLAP